MGLVQVIVKRFGHVDSLIDNTKFSRNDIPAVTIDDFDWTVRFNFLALFMFLAQCCERI